MDSLDPKKGSFSSDGFAQSKSQDFDIIEVKNAPSSSSNEKSDNSGLIPNNMESFFKTFSNGNDDVQEDFNKSNNHFLQNHPDFNVDSSTLLHNLNGMSNIDSIYHNKILDIDFSKIIQEMNFNLPDSNEQEIINQSHNFIGESGNPLNGFDFLNVNHINGIAETQIQVLENQKIFQENDKKHANTDAKIENIPLDNSLNNNVIEISNTNDTVIIDSPLSTADSTSLNQKPISPIISNNAPSSPHSPSSPMVVGDSSLILDPINSFNSPSLSYTSIINIPSTSENQIESEIKLESSTKAIEHIEMDKYNVENSILADPDKALSDNSVLEIENSEKSFSRFEPLSPSIKLIDLNNNSSVESKFIIENNSPEIIQSSYIQEGRIENSKDKTSLHYNLEHKNENNILFENVGENSISRSKSPDDHLSFETYSKKINSDNLNVDDLPQNKSPASLSERIPMLSPQVLSRVYSLPISSNSSNPSNLQNPSNTLNQSNPPTPKNQSNISNTSNAVNVDIRPVLSLNSSPSIFNSNLSNKVVIVQNSPHKDPKIHIEVNPNSYQNSSLDKIPSSYQSFNIEFSQSKDSKPGSNLLHKNLDHNLDFTNNNNDDSPKNEHVNVLVRFPIESSEIKNENTPEFNLTSTHTLICSTSNPETPIIESVNIAKRKSIQEIGHYNSNGVFFSSTAINPALSTDQNNSICIESANSFRQTKRIKLFTDDLCYCLKNPYYQVDNFEKYCMVLGNFLSVGSDSIKSAFGVFSSLKKGVSPICIKWSTNNLVAISWPQSINKEFVKNERLDSRDVKKQTSSLLSDESLGNKNDFRTSGSPVHVFQLISSNAPNGSPKRQIELMRIGQLLINHNDFKFSRSNKFGLGGKIESSETGVSNIWWNKSGSRIIVAEPSGRIAIFENDVSTSIWNQVRIIDYICPVSSAIWLPDSREYFAFVNNNDHEHMNTPSKIDKAFNIKLGPSIRVIPKESDYGYIILTCAGRFELSQKINRSGQRKSIDLSSPEDCFCEDGIWVITHSDIHLADNLKVVVVAKWLFISKNINQDSSKLKNNSFQIYVIDISHALMSNSDLKISNHIQHVNSNWKDETSSSTTLLKLIPPKVPPSSFTSDNKISEMPLLVICNSSYVENTFITFIELYDINNGINLVFRKKLIGLASGVHINRSNIMNSQSTSNSIALNNYMPWFLSFSNGRILHLHQVTESDDFEILENDIVKGSEIGSTAFSCLSYNFSGVLKVTEKSSKIVSDLEIKTSLTDIVDISVQTQKEILGISQLSSTNGTRLFCAVVLSLKVINNYDLKDLLLSFNNFSQEHQRSILLAASKLICKTLGTSDIVVDPRFSNSAKFIKFLGFAANNLTNIENTILQSNLMILLNFANISKVYLSLFGSEMYQNLSIIQNHSFGQIDDIPSAQSSWWVFIRPYLDKIDSIASWVLETSILLIRDIVLYFKQAIPVSPSNRYTDFYWAYSRLAVVAYPQILDCIISSLNLAEFLTSEEFNLLSNLPPNSLPKIAAVSQNSPLPLKTVLSIFISFRSASLESEDANLFYEMLFGKVVDLKLPSNFTNKIKSVLDDVFDSTGYHSFDNFINFSQSTPSLLSPVSDVVSYPFRDALFTYILPKETFKVLERNSIDFLNQSSNSLISEETKIFSFNEGMESYNRSIEVSNKYIGLSDTGMAMDAGFLTFCGNKGSLNALSDLRNVDAGMVKFSPNETNALDKSNINYHVKFSNSVDQYKESCLSNDRNVGYLVSHLRLMNSPTIHRSLTENRIPLLNDIYDVIYKNNLSKNVSMINNYSKGLLSNLDIANGGQIPSIKDFNSIFNSRLSIVNLSNPNPFLRVCNSCGNFTNVPSIYGLNDMVTDSRKSSIDTSIDTSSPLFQENNNQNSIHASKKAIDHNSFFNFDNFCICGGQWIFV
ncbi:hypothetical protein AYI69_g1762 [Smittium culicis]|uniref:Uncharacterized protein n=1 Tax=Smittium culicis TaxID=133412 RepID=A0A1R1YPB8_9FUNG|nr:hypothetical protein AYI69_g1762 [Smittium culicis]